MKKAAKILVIGGTAVGIIFLGYKGYQYVQNLKRIEEQVVITTNARVDKITILGVSLKVDYNIKNPTNAFLKMSAPLIRILIEKRQVATSDMNAVDIPANYRDSQNRIVIKPNQETGNISTSIMIPWVAMAGIAPELLKRLNSSDQTTKTDIEVEIKSTVYTLAGALPYSSSETFQI